MQTFEQYLHQNGFSKETIKAYRCIVEKYIQMNPDAPKYNYQDVVNYMFTYNKTPLSNNTKQSKLTALKKYYDYLITNGKRDDHPCKLLTIKGTGKKGIVFTDLMTMQELETLIEREERYEHLKLKNQIIITLLIYQALQPNEIIKLKTQHVDLDEGTIHVSGGKELTSRKLPLVPRQIRMMDNYLNGARKALLNKKENNTNDYLLINYQGNNDTSIDNIVYLIETLKPRYPEKKLTTKLIRDSVISHWLNERKIPLEQVQLIAGHRWISSTLRYRRENTEEQRKTINKYHPLG